MASAQKVARDIARLYRKIQTLEGVINDVSNKVPPAVAHRLDAAFDPLELMARDQLQDALHDAGVYSPIKASDMLLDYFLDRSGSFGPTVAKIDPPAETEGGDAK